MRIGIIGSGSMGLALGKFFANAGHDILFGTRTLQRVNDWIASEGLHARSGSYAEAARFGDIVFLVTRWPDTPSAIKAAGSLDGKILVDSSNPSGADGFYHVGTGRVVSAAEEIANWASGARVVKAFNNLYGSMLLAGTQFGSETPSVFHCGDDEAAKEVAAGLIREAGLDPGRCRGSQERPLSRTAGRTHGAPGRKHGLGRPEHRLQALAQAPRVTAPASRGSIPDCDVY